MLHFHILSTYIAIQVQLYPLHVYGSVLNVVSIKNISFYGNNYLKSYWHSKLFISYNREENKLFFFISIACLKNFDKKKKKNRYTYPNPTE